MSELISRQAAIDAIQKLNIPEDMCVFEIISHIEVEIATLPPVQPNHNAEVSKKEIIHCKDCKRQDINNDFRSMWCHEIRTFVKPDEFCCWAEKIGEADADNG